MSVDKLFPKLDYEKLAADGMDKSSFAVLKAARETLPHKPSGKWKYKKNRYISAIRQALEVAQSVLDGNLFLTWKMQAWNFDSWGFYINSSYTYWRSVGNFLFFNILLHLPCIHQFLQLVGLQKEKMKM